MHIIFWLSHFSGTKPGYTTPKVAARFKDFDDEAKAQAFYEKMKALEGKEYQSRLVSAVTKSW